MAELLKNMYNKAFFEGFSKALKNVKPDFNSASFLKHIYDTEWEQRELKQRMRHITVVLKQHLYNAFDDNVQTILRLIAHLENQGIKEKTIEFMFLPDFIEHYGLAHYDTSVKAMERISQFTSCEFAVRPFIITYPTKMIPQMQLWANHKHHMVRRLATEGCRPRLPWAMAIPSLKADPKPILPILELLKNDASETVRRSVANNLNDISKDHPNTVLTLAKKWQDQTQSTDWVIKHGCRTLLKQGHQEAMKLFGFGSVEKIKINQLKIKNPKVAIGGVLAFEFQLENTSETDTKIRIEYGIYYQKANGALAKKVFKISEKNYPKQSKTSITRKQSFKPITTRKFYVGKHQLSIIINGVEVEKTDFELIR